MLEIISDRICQPGNSGIQLLAGGRDMFQSLLDRDGLNKSIAFRMGE
ncbi:MAG: hypothetical protein MK312_05045 [Roseibacillus sp.]|nr:hypothetical protein [Roseibacillus sp.]